MQALELAYELTRKEFPNGGVLIDTIKDRSMEIFAGAFAEWANMESYIMGVYDGKVIWFKYFLNNTGEFTTSQLITEFEKIDNK